LGIKVSGFQEWKVLEFNGFEVITKQDFMVSGFLGRVSKETLEITKP
jgi:hypothetical protein